MFYKRKKVVHLNFKNAKAANAANAAKAANASKETKEPTALAAKAALAEHIFRLKFEKNMRKLFGVNKKT
uniref:Uncharacterized protein n=1 Tax=viral metagenome TaxID=1070528 RepID=A0A6C0K6L7_9ZZZZ